MIHVRNSSARGFPRTCWAAMAVSPCPNHRCLKKSDHEAGFKWPVFCPYGTAVLRKYLEVIRKERGSLGKFLRHKRAPRTVSCLSPLHHTTLPLFMIVSVPGVHSITVAFHRVPQIHRQTPLHPGHPAFVFISVKAGGMRIVQKHPHTGDGKEEKDKDDQEWESTR